MPRECEESASRPPASEWFKSSYSVGNSHCLETQRLNSGDLAVRDSKNVGPFLAFPASTWRRFVGGLKDGAFDAS
jgi:hypothetical protein